MTYAAHFEYYRAEQLATLTTSDTIISNQSTLLTYMGRLNGERWLKILVTVDAYGVLAGAVLTSYVGINGLL